MIDAVAELTTTVSDVELVVVGHDDTPDRRNEARLRERAAQLGISDRIHYTGHLGHSATIRTIASGDVLVDPRTISSFSSCVYEAMTIGIPVVASDVACNRLALENGDCGLLVPPDDPTALAAAVRAVVSDVTVAERLRAAGLEKSHRADRETGTDSVAAALVAA